MTAAEVLARALGAGGQVIRDASGPRLRVPREMRHLVEAHRSEIRALILAGAAPVPTPRPTPRAALGWPAVLPALGRRGVQAFTPCHVCRAGTWVVYGCFFKQRRGDQLRGVSVKPGVLLEDSAVHSSEVMAVGPSRS